MMQFSIGAKREAKMTYNDYNDFCGSLPATSHVVQWGGADVWKVGGKVFAIGGWGEAGKPAITFKVSDHNFEVLREQPGFRPAPYLASRGMKWIQLHDVAVTTNDEIRYYLKESYRIVSLGLTKKLQKELGLNQG